MVKQSGITDASNVAQWVNNQLKNPPKNSFKTWIKDNAAASADEDLREIYDESKGLFKTLCHITPLQDETRFRTWVERVGELEVSLQSSQTLPSCAYSTSIQENYKAAMERYGLPELPSAEIITRACLCSDTMLQV